MMYRRFVLFCVIALSLPGALVSAEYPLEFMPGTCPVQFAGGAEVECGVVTVPQDQLHPEQRSLSLAVAVFKARSDSPAPDPLIFLDGGPGSRTLDSLAGGLGPFLIHFNAQRDVIIFDYRGMGHSDPALTCPESLDALDDSWVSLCRARYAERGVDVTYFTTRDNAADAADIVRALGYESYNVWGGSYGSSVALTLLRDHPENIRAAIITALQAPQGDLQAAIPVYFQRTLDAISALCQADTTCKAAFPGDLSEEVAAVVERLNAEPLKITVHGTEAIFKGSDLMMGLGTFLKDEQNIPLLPGLLAALDAGQYQDIETYANALSTPPDPLNPIGAWLSMRCTDSILATTPDAISAESGQHPTCFPSNLPGDQRGAGCPMSGLGRARTR